MCICACVHGVVTTIHMCMSVSFEKLKHKQINYALRLYVNISASAGEKVCEALPGGRGVGAPPPGGRADLGFFRVLVCDLLYFTSNYTYICLPQNKGKAQTDISENIIQ